MPAPKCRLGSSVMLLAGMMLLIAGCGLREFEYEFQAMSTQVRVTAYARYKPSWGELDAAAVAWVRQIDYRERDSATAVLNTVGSLSGGVEGSALLQAVLSDAVQVAERTGGAYDPTVLPLVRLWDFDGGGRLPDASAIKHAVSLVDYSTVDVTGPLMLAPGQQVDLGGIGKGAVVDLIADHLSKRGVERFLVEAGGDLLVSGLKPGERRWRIWVQHPRARGSALAIIEIGEADKRRAVVTSGDYERYVEVNGVRYHHILDPETGWPARESVSVTVIAGRAAVADALATGLFVVGPDGLAWFEGDADVQAIVVTEEDGVLAAHATDDFPVALDDLNLN